MSELLMARAMNLRVDSTEQISGVKSSSFLIEDAQCVYKSILTSVLDGWVLTDREPASWGMYTDTCMCRWSG